MPKIIKPLTDTGINNAKPKAKTYELSDGDGLMLRIKTSGAKTWLFKYYKPHSKTRTNLTLGNYPDLTLARARTKHKDARAMLAEGIDPKQATVTIPDTFKLVMNQWLSVKKTRITKNFANDILRSLELHILPAIGDIPIDKLTAPLVIDALKPAKESGYLETVRRVCQRINEVMVFATNTGIIHNNPLAGIKSAFPLPDKKNMLTIKPERLPQLLRAIYTASIRTTIQQLTLWQLHTMLRPRETAGTMWCEIDYKNALWVISKERMKMKRGHTVPLTTQMLDILDTMKPLSVNSDYVFPSDRDKAKHANSQSVNMAIKRMGFKGELVSHGLRSLASTTLNNQGFDADIIESALAHIDKNETRAAYNRADYLQRRTTMMVWWSEHIEQALSEGFTAKSTRGLSLARIGTDNANS